MVYVSISDKLLIRVWVRVTGLLNFRFRLLFRVRVKLSISNNVMVRVNGLVRVSVRVKFCLGLMALFW